ncbi:MAG: YggS family pyridoxal phosphate-dependent enzyme [Anaerolineales bacterium]
MDERIIKTTNIRDNYERALERINLTALNTGRDPKEIRLVVVTKTHPVDMIQSVIDAGAMELGENYIEEAIPKIQALTHNQGLQWHMIGHVQSRKTKSVCEYFQYVHSVDSVKIAERLSQSALAQGKSLPVWLEFNVSGEASKSGWNISQKDNWNTILPDIEKILILPNLVLLGVMTVPPFLDDSEEVRPYYRRLRKFQDYVIEHFQLSNFHELSMGMSSDFEIAIQEGSTCVRIGQAILGPRTN